MCLGGKKNECIACIYHIDVICSTGNMERSRTSVFGDGLLVRARSFHGHLWIWQQVHDVSTRSIWGLGWERKQCSHQHIEEGSVSSKVGGPCSSLWPSSLHANTVRNPGQKLNSHLQIKWGPFLTGRTWASTNARKTVHVSTRQILKIQMPSPLMTKNSWAGLFFFFCIPHYFWFPNKLLSFMLETQTLQPFLLTLRILLLLLKEALEVQRSFIPRLCQKAPLFQGNTYLLTEDRPR